MLVHTLLIILALILLFFGAEGLVRGASALALRAGLNPLLIGLTVVAFGTSAPELVVSVKSSLAGQGDISLGNVVGSNTFNIGIILGLTALICPIPVHRQIIRIDGPIALVVAITAYILMLDDHFGRVEGFILFIGICAYTWMNISLAKRSTTVPQDNKTEDLNPSQSLTSIRQTHWGVHLAYVLGGLVLLILGSHLLVHHSTSLARAFNISEAVIGLTIVAAGTSMPELTTSLVAAFRRQSEIAVGNVVGSNVFNILGILGLSGIIAPIHAPTISTFDYLMMIGFTVLLLPLLFTGKTLIRTEGVLLLIGYGVYMLLLWPS